MTWKLNELLADVEEVQKDEHYLGKIVSWMKEASKEIDRLTDHVDGLLAREEDPS